MKIAKKILKFLFIIFLVFILFLGLVSLIVRSRPYDKLPVIGGYKPLNVLGGSMEPAIKLGSVVLVKQANGKGIKVGNILTYKPPKKINGPQDKTLTTHRVVKIIKKNGALFFKTKGDANKAADINLVNEGQLLGKVVLVIPYLGKLGTFAKTQNGFLLLVVLPGLAIIITELISIFKNIKVLKRQGSD